MTTDHLNGTSNHEVILETSINVKMPFAHYSLAFTAILLDRLRWSPLSLTTLHGLMASGKAGVSRALTISKRPFPPPPQACCLLALREVSQNRDQLFFSSSTINARNT